MLAKLNNDNLYNILLYNTDINYVNNNLHISKYIYNLIINNYNIIYKEYMKRYKNPNELKGFLKH